MIETVFHGDRLPAAERFPSRRDLAFESHAPHEIPTDHAADFRATLRMLRGAMRITQGNGSLVVRTGELVDSANCSPST